MERYFNSSQLDEVRLDIIHWLPKPLPKEYFMQIKRLAVQLLDKQLEGTLGKWEKDNNITEANYEKLSKEHYRTFKRES